MLCCICLFTGEDSAKFQFKIVIDTTQYFLALFKIQVVNRFIYDLGLTDKPFKTMLHFTGWSNSIPDLNVVNLNNSDAAVSQVL